MAEWIGLRVRLFFKDTEKVLIKIGKITAIDSNFVLIETDDGLKQIIPKERVVRMEIIK